MFVFFVKDGTTFLTENCGKVASPVPVFYSSLKNAVLLMFGGVATMGRGAIEKSQIIIIVFFCFAISLENTGNEVGVMEYKSIKVLLASFQTPR